MYFIKKKFFCAILFSLLRIIISQSKQKEDEEEDDIILIERAKKAILEFNEVQIIRFSKGNHKLAVALINKTVLVYDDHKSRRVPQLNKIMQFKLKNMQNITRDLLVFKIDYDKRIGEHLIYCTKTKCSVINISNKSNLEYNIDNLNLRQESSKSLEATVLNDQQLLLKCTDENSSVNLYKPQSSTPIKWARNAKFVYSMNVIGSFLLRNFTYFIGDDKKINIPYNLFYNDSSRRIRRDVRITRVCNNDKTQNFDSRIDIALTCESQYNHQVSAIEVTGFSLSSDNNRLYILMNVTNINSHRSHFAVCKFNMSTIENFFLETWETCQQSNNSLYASVTCQTERDANDSLCYIYSGKLSGRFPVCKAYDDINTNITNCEVDNSNAASLGWLDNYRPIEGELLFNQNKSPYLSFLETLHKDVFFVLQSDSVQKIMLRNSKVLWSTPQLQSKKLPMTLAARTHKKKFMGFFYYDYDKLIYLPDTCKALYKTCQQISWEDPLDCIYCSKYNGSGFTTARNDTNCDDQILFKICPPVIKDVYYDPFSYTYSIKSDSLSKLKDITVVVCNEECNYSLINKILLQCHKESLCDLTLYGKYESNYIFNITYDKNYFKRKIDEKYQGLKNKYLHYILIMIVCVILILLLIIIRKLYYIYAKKIEEKLKMQTYHSRFKQRNLNSKYILVSCDESSANNGNFSFSQYYHLKQLPNRSFNNDKKSIVSYYDELSVTSKQLSGKKRIKFIKHIGNGFSSQVHLAKYINKRNLDESFYVAVKIVNNSAFCLDDVMREIKLISKCNHKNIVQYFGHFLDENNQMHIITEYMAGSDLHRFLINPDNRPTVGDAFLYILQICEGMEYLTKEHIIHRDLAARNCMLDSLHLTIKITDFGLCRASNVDYEYICGHATQQLPFRWTALECLGTYTKFSEKSDVWSFGVVVWEIFARNIQPYEGRDINGVVSYLNSGRRLEIKNLPVCPEEIYKQVMLPCWHKNPNSRPTFSKLRKIIERIYWNFKENSIEYLKQNYETPISTIGSPTFSFENSY